MQNDDLNIEPVVMQIARFGDINLAHEVVDAFAENSGRADEFKYISKLYLNLGDNENALVFAEKALEVSDDKTEIELNLISLYRQNAYPQKALNLINKLQNEDNYEALELEKSGCLYEMNYREKSFEILNGLKEENLSEYFKQKYTTMMGTHNLWNGNFRTGLIQTIISGSNVRNYEANNPNLFHGRKELDLPFWEGTPDCKNLIIYAEAGVGDEILNIRFMKHLQKKGIKAVWYGVWHDNPEVNRRTGVVDLFRNSGFDIVTNLNQIKNPQDYMWTYSQYLPINLGLEAKDLYYGPYLKTPNIDVPKDKTNIGIRWYGNLNPRFRNYPLRQLYEIIKTKNANFYSLQKYEGMDEMDDFPGIVDLSPKINSFYETAKYINSMDVVITSCTSVAHCAAALGKKTFIFVPISAYYPWCHPTEKSPWYGDNVTLLRQKTPRVWDEPMAELAAILEKQNI